MIDLLLIVELVRFTGPAGTPIDVNPETIISVRTPQAEALRAEHFAPGTQCLLFTVDGKYIAIREDCGIARLKLGGKQGGHL